MSIRKISFLFRRKLFDKIVNPLILLDQVNFSLVFEGIYHQRLTGLLPVIGYTLFFASLGDYIYIIFPTQFQDPAWELQTLGALVEQSWGFLIALALIFSRYFTDNQNNVREIELLALKFICWLIFIMAIIFILSTPLIAPDTHRLYKSINQQVNREDAVKLAQIAEVLTQIPSL